jgi:transketolase
MTPVTNEVFATTIRAATARMTARAGSSHIGSCFSIADVVAVLYNQVLNLFPDDPKHDDRDRFVLSKGHACAVVYAALAERGFFPLQELETYAEEGSRLMAHISHKVPGVEFSTGSLGHGLPFATGIALSAAMRDLSWRTVVLLGDGELDEGSNWEALLFAAHHKLSNLTIIIDANNLQSLTTTTETLNLGPLEAKLSAFGVDVKTVDGHSCSELSAVLSAPRGDAGRPLVVIAQTIKGKGVDFMENQVEWHYRSPNPQELEQALQQIEGRS